MEVKTKTMSPPGTDLLVVAQAESIKQELMLFEPDKITGSDADDALIKQANDVVDKLLSVNPDEHTETTPVKEAVESMGLRIQKRAAEESAMLKQPVGEMSKRSEEGSDVSNALVNLKIQVEELDPTRFDFSPGWFSRLFGMLPFIGTPIKRYFTKYESAQTVLAAIENSLEKGQKQLERDNITLQQDQANMRELTKELKNAIQLGQLIDQRLETRCQREIKQDDPRYKFIMEELLHPLRVRIQDLQQQMIVNQQGILTMEVIIRNNKELIRGVTRAMSVTMNALTTAVVLAEALNHQKITLTKIKALNETTNNMIAGTARMLKEQTPEISKLASEAAISMDTLKTAYADIRSALDEISNFKQRALPEMANNILQMDNMVNQQEEVIHRLEEGNKVSNSFRIDVI
ncbi:MAG: toxic anion resistance protein [Gammaproteobacteria bacterium]|nr:toxic anion resistance protein [Gammaproteobacteria bacterium]MDH5651976.1 toxic anion resistance protein [Gammaproteobacteria bacterium]